MKNKFDYRKTQELRKSEGFYFENGDIQYVDFSEIISNNIRKISNGIHKEQSDWMLISPLLIGDIIANKKRKKAEIRKSELAEVLFDDIMGKLVC